MYTIMHEGKQATVQRISFSARNIAPTLGFMEFITEDELQEHTGDSPWKPAYLWVLDAHEKMGRADAALRQGLLHFLWPNASSRVHPWRGGARARPWRKRGRLTGELVEKMAGIDDAVARRLLWLVSSVTSYRRFGQILQISIRLDHHMPTWP